MATAVPDIPDAIDILSYSVVEGPSNAVRTGGAAAGAAAGALLGNVPGAMIGGIVGAISASQTGHIQYEIAISMRGITLSRFTRWSAVEQLAEKMKHEVDGRPVHTFEVVRLAHLLPSKKLVIAADVRKITPGSEAHDRVRGRIEELKQFFGRLLELWRRLESTGEDPLAVGLFRSFFELPMGIPSQQQAAAEGEAGLAARQVGVDYGQWRISQSCGLVVQATPVTT